MSWLPISSAQAITINGVPIITAESPTTNIDPHSCECSIPFNGDLKHSKT